MKGPNPVKLLSIGFLLHTWDSRYTRVYGVALLFQLGLLLDPRSSPAGLGAVLLSSFES